MKTLDELIKDLTEMTANPTEGDYENEGYYLAKDTLLYLKMYRSDTIQWEADRKMWAEKGPEIEKKQNKLIKAAKDFQKAKAEMEEISADYVALKQWWTELQENPPLTWGELRTMSDKPVWWKHGEVGEWLTIYGVPSLKNGNDNVIYATTCSGVECWIYKKDMDKYKYYRKEKLQGE